MKIKKQLVPINVIKIPASFAKSKPRIKKMEECRKFYETHGVQDRYIVLNKNNYCIDGYIMYLVLKEQGEQCVEVVYSRKNRKLRRKTNGRFLGRRSEKR